MALPLANTAEGVTTGTTLTTTLSASGGNAFDTVTQGTNATLQASTTQAAGGTESYRIVMGSPFANTRNIWSTSMGTQTLIYGRMYLWMSALPTTNMAVAQMATGSRMGAVVITTTGKIQWASQTTTLAGTASTATVPTSAWFRIEWSYQVIAAGNANGSAYYFNTAAVESATPTETITATAMVTNAQANFTQVNLGQNDGGLAAATNFYMDNLALSGTGLPGPAGAAAAAVVPELVMAPRIPSY